MLLEETNNKNSEARPFSVEDKIGLSFVQGVRATYLKRAFVYVGPGRGSSGSEQVHNAISSVLAPLRTNI